MTEVIEFKDYTAWIDNGQISWRRKGYRFKTPEFQNKAENFASRLLQGTGDFKWVEDTDVPEFLRLAEEHGFAVTGMPLPAEPVRQKRKIIQIAVVPEDESDFRALTALCDDGSLWLYQKPGRTENPKWSRIPDIPQD